MILWDYGVGTLGLVVILDSYNFDIFYYIIMKGVIVIVLPIFYFSY